MTRFVADAADCRRAVALDGLVALYHRPSGTTHLLAPPSPQILDVIANDPAELSEILARLRARFDLDAETGAERALDARLDELERAGLVRRA